jgi:hypothetical protein
MPHRSPYVPTPVSDGVMSTHDLPAAGFAPHGEFRVGWRDGVVWWDAIGPFNLEALQRYDRMRALARQRWLVKGRWFGGVVHWHHSALMSPEAFEAYTQGFVAVYSRPHRLAAVAWVADPELEGMRFMRRRFASLFEQYHLLMQEFEHPHEADAWVRAQRDARERAEAAAAGDEPTPG